MNRSTPALLIALCCFATGCSRALAVDPAPGPRVLGDSVSFPPGAAQLAALAVAPAGEAGPASTRLCGRLTWDDDVTARVFTPFAGRVRRVLVDVGRPVRRGQALAEVESPEFGQAQADARAARSALALATGNAARLRDLLEHGAAAQKDVEAAEDERARAETEQARARARLASCGAASDSVTGLFVLRSPLDGVVVERNLTPGQEIRADQMLANAPALFSPLFVVSDPSRLWVQIDATEFDLAALRPGAPFRFTTPADPGHAFTGTVGVIADGIDPATHTLHARGEVDNAARMLKAEMFVTVEVPGRAATGTSVDARAVYLQGDRHYVFVEDTPGRFTRHEVTVDAQDGARVLVSRGVRRGDRVVTDGCVLLQHLLD